MWGEGPSAGDRSWHGTAGSTTESFVGISSPQRKKTLVGKLSVITSLPDQTVKVLRRRAPGSLLQVCLLFFLLLKMSHHLYNFLILCQWTDKWQRKPRTEIFSEYPGYDLQASDFSCHGEKYQRAGAGKWLAGIKIPFFVLKAAAFSHPQECSRPKLAYKLRLFLSKCGRSLSCYL